MATAQERGIDLKEISREQAKKLDVPSNRDAKAMAEAVRATASGEISGFFSGTEKGLDCLQEAGAGEDVRKFMAEFGVRASSLLKELEEAIDQIADGGESAGDPSVAPTIRPTMEQQPEGLNPYGDTMPVGADAEQEQNARKYLSSAPAIPRSSRVPKFDLPDQDEETQP
jgi:hypothetical protein